MAHRSADRVTGISQAIAFGRFRLLPAQQLLLRDGHPVAIGARALQVLVTLAQRAGEVVSNKELTAAVWPDTFVEESNLRVHVANLRRALWDGQDGSRYVVNVPGRGYSFVASVAIQGTPTNRPTPASEASLRASLPPSPPRVLGRGEIIETICASIPKRRLTTLVGPSGIGKTTVALAVARRLAAAYRHGVAFIDFASIGDHEMVSSRFSAAFGLPITADNSLPLVLSYLRDRHVLLLLDSCEHVIEAVAGAAEAITGGAESVHILATSLEPLRAAGEHVVRLQPLATPAPAADLTAAEALTFPGVQLLVERASASQDGFVLSDADAPYAAEICRRLDGIALAIELAAGCIATFGLRELASRLDDRFRLLTGGRRTALPRHQTLAATLDWSYGLLSERGRLLLRRLAVFNGGFAIEGAAAIFAGADDVDVLEQLADLVAKSLVVSESAVGPARFRLLDTTRLYGLEKLRHAGELNEARRRHACFMVDLFASAEADCETMPHSEWMARFATQLDNIRAALDWAAGAEGDAAICVDLAVAAVPLWVQLSLMTECRNRVEHALALLERHPELQGAVAARMKLSAARGWSLMYGTGRSDATRAAWEMTLGDAEALGDAGYKSRALWGMWIGTLNKGNWASALQLAGQLSEHVAQNGDPWDEIMVDRVLATTLHYRGDQAKAEAAMERMLARYAELGNQPRVARFQVDQKVAAHYFLARILWLRGCFEQARRMVDHNISEGLELDHALTFCSVLGQGACPIALFTGDLVGARRFSTMLLDHAARYGLNLWHEWARGFQGLVAAHEGEPTRGLALMNDVLERVGENRFLPRYMILNGEMAAWLGQTGEGRLGLQTIDRLIERCQRSEERWYLPEALRVKAELIAQTGGEEARTTADRLLMRAIRLARTQAARAWELRASADLLHLHRGSRREAAARAGLARVLNALKEGFGTPDTVRAKSLLEIT